MTNDRKTITQTASVSIAHTPGPWKSYDDWYVKSQGGTGAITTVCKPILPHVSDEECKGNARLIAESPQMLKVIEIVANATGDTNLEYAQELSQEILMRLKVV